MKKQLKRFGRGALLILCGVGIVAAIFGFYLLITTHLILGILVGFVAFSYAMGWCFEDKGDYIW